MGERCPYKADVAGSIPATPTIRCSLPAPRSPEIPIPLFFDDSQELSRAKFNIDSLAPIKVKKGKTLFKNDSVEFFKDSRAVAEALSQAILKGDKEAFHDIISAYLSVINKEELTRRSKVPIATIRRMAAGANFNIDNMLKVTSAISKEFAA